MKTPQVAILLCTYNGERFIKEQLDSYTHQGLKDWTLFVYDDGSTDSTQAIIDQYQQSLPSNPVHWLPNAKKQGFAHNFLNAISLTPDPFDFYALSDQDDVWCANKLSRATEFLSGIAKDIPAVYGSRTVLVDAEGKTIGMSRLFNKPPTFKNALMQSIAGGNTLVLNKAARALVCRADTTMPIVSHDWFIYQLVTGAGGVFHYDSQPELLYRQHGNNLIGSNLGFFARLYRMTNLFNGTFKRWNDSNLVALQKNKDLLTPENRSLLALFVQARDESWLHRPSSFFKLDIYRQQWIDNVALFFAWMVNRL